MVVHWRLPLSAASAATPQPKRIEEHFTREGELWEVQVGGQEIATTPEHPFFVREKGWTPAGELIPGDLLSTATGQWLPVERLENTGRLSTIFNMRVADFATYFVTPHSCAFGVWVHNTYLSQQIRRGNVTLDAATGRVNGVDPVTNSSVLLSRGRGGLAASLEHAFPREALRQAKLAAGAVTPDQSRLLASIVDANPSNIVVSKAFNSAKGARTAYEFAQTPTGRQVLLNNPQYLIGLARQQRSASRAINHVLGGNFAPAKFIDDAARLEALLVSQGNRVRI